MAVLFRSVAALAALLISAPVAPAVSAAEPPSPSPSIAQTESPVAAAVDGRTLRLEDGRLVVLAGIEAPHLAPGWPTTQPWPLAEAARQALAALTLGKTPHLVPLEQAYDRMGRLRVQAYGAHGDWLQAMMVKQGLARVHLLAEAATPVPPGVAGQRMLMDLLALEQTARAARRGIWALDFYRVLTPAETVASGDGYRIVEGVVSRVSAGGRNTYIGFGPDWRHELSLAMSGAERRHLERQGFRVRALVGRRVRVRGWFGAAPTPEIQVSRREQIELVVP